MIRDDSHDYDQTLERFVRAQASSYGTALGELRAGAKRSHWMWYVFPQCRGLGRSGLAKQYAIVSLVEAREYLTHPVLGVRLRECTRAVLGHSDRTARQIFGLDDIKFRSCMTLFELASTNDRIFADALDRFFEGERDGRTLDLIREFRD